MYVVGTFQAIEHVFIVGVGGGVPHFTDYYKHPRLGDVIVSEGDKSGKIYYYCDKILQVSEQVDSDNLFTKKCFNIISKSDLKKS